MLRKIQFFGYLFLIYIRLSPVQRKFILTKFISLRKLSLLPLEHRKLLKDLVFISNDNRSECSPIGHFRGSVNWCRNYGTRTMLRAKSLSSLLLTFVWSFGKKNSMRNTRALKLLSKPLERDVLVKNLAREFAMLACEQFS